MSAAHSLSTQSLSEETRAFLGRPHALLIDGHWQGAAASGGFVSINPADGEPIAELSAAGAKDIDAAVRAARAAFEDGRWRRLAPEKRAAVLWRVAELIERELAVLAEIEALDCGKLLISTREAEVPFAAEVFRYHAGWCTKLEGRQLAVGHGERSFQCTMVHEPIGVAALIVPWNGPLTMSAWKIAPALAAGCTMVVKPSELACLSVVKLAELLEEAGVPAGVVNVVTGTGEVAGAALVRHRGVDKISFTGSGRTGREILRAAVDRLPKLTLELGGKSPVIVCADANLDEAVESIIGGIYGGAGQMCVAGSRLLVHEHIERELLERLTARARGLRLGSGLNADTQMGPLISAAHRERVLQLVQCGVREGATLVTGGHAPQRAGFFFEPTILTRCSREMTPVREEIFGPVLTVQSWRTPDEVIAAANDTDYGLAGSIWTQDLRRAQLLCARVRAGLLWVNAHAVPHPAVPFGGYKSSGWGREQGRDAINEFCELKSVMVRA
jgi:phenylacetaldehyde dehydrogenase